MYEHVCAAGSGNKDCAGQISSLEESESPQQELSMRNEGGLVLPGVTCGHSGSSLREQLCDTFHDSQHTDNHHVSYRITHV